MPSILITHEVAGPWDDPLRSSQKSNELCECFDHNNMVAVLNVVTVLLNLAVTSVHNILMSVY